MVRQHFDLLVVQCPLVEHPILEYYPDIFIGKPARILQLIFGLRSWASKVLCDAFPALLG
jgi:hypothetical protein